MLHSWRSPNNNQMSDLDRTYKELVSQCDCKVLSSPKMYHPRSRSRSRESCGLHSYKNNNSSQLTALIDGVYCSQQMSSEVGDQNLEQKCIETKAKVHKLKSRLSNLCQEIVHDAKAEMTQVTTQEVSPSTTIQ